MPADFAAHIEAVARRLLGEPNSELSSRDEWRYGTHGSLAVDVHRGTWFDHQRQIGGGVLDYIADKLKLSNGAAVEWLKTELGICLDDQSEAQRRIVAAYDYRDETGSLLFQVVRFEPKDFRQRRPDGNGGWAWGVKGVRPVPYRLPELLKRPEGTLVYICEGEKDCDRLAKLGLVATCNVGGASEGQKSKWRPELNGHFLRATVCIIPDNDGPGLAHARQIAASLHGIAATVRIVDLPDLPHKGDVSDWLASGGTRERLIALCEAAAVWKPTADAAEDDGGLLDWDAGDDDADIPPRGWLLGNAFCRRFLSSLIATGGTGKTAVRTAQALSMATGRSLSGEHVFRRARVLFVSLEDDRDELRRRVRAAMMHYGISPADVRGWLILAAITGKQWKLATAAKSGEVHRAQLADRLEKVIVHRKIDAVILDPFIKSHGVPENDNGAIDQVAAILAHIAIEHDCAVDAPHHTNKMLAEPGNANSARGASSFKDAGRLTYTLLPMTPDEAQIFGVPEEERRRLVRIDSGKVNLVPGSTAAQWFRLVSVPIGNATPEYPNGDSLQVAEPWTPPDFWRDLPPSLCCRIIDEIDAGMEDGERYSGAPQAKARGAWNVVLKQAPNLTEKQARNVIKTWLKNEVLEEREYHSKARREECTGLFANPAKRPGGCTSG
ncbi:MAG: AAA family ATPase [Rhodoplanes sp.]